MAEAATAVEATAAAVEHYNEVVEELNQHLDDAIGEIDGYVEERSERWQEGETAQRYAKWRDALENAKIDRTDPPEFSAIEAVDLIDEPEAPPLALDEV